MHKICTINNKKKNTYSIVFSKAKQVYTEIQFQKSNNNIKNPTIPFTTNLTFRHTFQQPLTKQIPLLGKIRTKRHLINLFYIKQHFFSYL